MALQSVVQRLRTHTICISLPCYFPYHINSDTNLVWKQICFQFLFPTAKQPLVSQGFKITFTHTTLGRTPLDEWSARCGDLYLKTHNTHKRERERDIQVAGGIRTPNPSKLGAANPRLRRRGHRYRPLTTAGKNFSLYYIIRRSQWPRGLRRRSLAARLLRLWFRIPPGVWIFVCCECCVLSGRGLCDGLIIRSEESYRMWRVVVCEQETS